LHEYVSNNQASRLRYSSQSLSLH